MARLHTALLTIGSLFSAGLLAAASLEYEVKAAFIYNFSQFVEWPQSANDDADKLNLCVLGQDPFGQLLEALEGRHTQNKTIQIKRLQNSTVEGVCHILFVSQSEHERLTSHINVIANTEGILSISDIEDFSRKGGVIEFHMVDNKVRFKINLKAARNANLAISSRLLSLATTVHE
jgi:hypothetical protein